MGAIFKGIYEKKFKILEEKLWSKIFSVCFSAAVFSLKKIGKKNLIFLIKIYNIENKY